MKLASEPKSGLIVLCANTPWDENPLGAKPLAQALAQHARVIYVDPPISYATALRQPNLRKSLHSDKLSLVDDNLYRLIPVVAPGKDRPFINRLTSRTLRHKIASAVKTITHHVPASHTAIITTAPHYRIFSHHFSSTLYWVMDDYASQPELTGIPSNLLVNGNRWQMHHANHVVAVSVPLADSLSSQFPSSSIDVITNGVEADQFLSRDNMSDQRARSLWPQLPNRKFALYVGKLSSRVDLNYLSAVAQAGLPLVLAGGIDTFTDETFRTQFDRIVVHENVVYLGNVNHEDIPALMYAAGVGLVPYADGSFNAVSMPLKIPEYLVTGMPVVSTQLAFVDAFSPDDVTGAPTPHKFADAVEEILNDPPTLGQRAMRASRIAAEWSWESKAKAFLELLR